MLMKYLGYYDIDDTNREKRVYFLAARNKMDYIAQSISLYETVEIVSPSGVVGNKSDSSRSIKINDNIHLKLFASIARNKRFIGKVSTFLTRVMFFFYLLFHLNNKEVVLVYHSLPLCKILLILKKIKHFKMILEVEELYSDVSKNNKERKLELSFIKNADAFLFPTSLLGNILNPNNKPQVIIHGTYQVEEKRPSRCFDNHLAENGEPIIHCVYAGTFDLRKGGVIAAIEASRYLPENYHIHIIGFGTPNEIQTVIDRINKIKSISKSTVSYDGMLTGEEYIEFLQKCDIGLSTQNPNDTFNDTSFPSKILSYLANGLRVVTVKIPVVTSSAINESVFYYEKQNPQSIAEAIMSVDLHSEFDGRVVVNNLSNQFIDDIRKMINNLEK